MRFSPSEQKTSFYETFSDLIFATMAIFVMLMIVFITQVNIEKDLEELEQQIQEAEQELMADKEKLEKEQANHQELQKSKKSLEQYNLELVIAVDTTGSMQVELDQLTDTISLIGQVLPKIATSAKIGVVAYRKDEKELMDIKTFPLQIIHDDSEDNGRSYTELYNFVRYLKAKTGSAPVELAMDQSLKMFTPANQFTGHQCFMLLGDVGPYEDSYQDQEVDNRNRQQERAMVDQLAVWSKGHLHRNVLILFSGDDEIQKTLKLQGKDGSQYQKYVRSRSFFESLAHGIGQPEAFSVNYSDMVPQLLNAMLK